MKIFRLAGFAALVSAAALSLGQAWSVSYQEALTAAKAGNWTLARGSFMQASANRTDDSAKPTRLPGPITEQRLWRAGSPYSPNFLAAYSGVRAALTLKDPADQTKLLETVADEFSALIDRGQVSQEAVFYLGQILVRLGQADRLKAFQKKTSAPGFKADWKVDTEILDPQELALARSSSEQVASVPSAPNKSNTITPAQLNAGQTGVVPNSTPNVIEKPTGSPNVSVLTLSPAGLTPYGSVAVVPTKFALIVGNSESRNPDFGLPYAGEDVMYLRSALLASAGYAESNVEVLRNATAEQIQDRAKALADRVQEGGTVLIYFAGSAANVNGKDYLAGTDADSVDSPNGMVSKAELYRSFVVKGARIFAFYQVNRPFKNGKFFGSELPPFGAIAQCQATVPGGMVLSTIRNGKSLGLYTDAFVGVISDFKSNRIPISEFGWQVFYRIRRGDTGNSSGGSLQTPTLPVLKNLAADARF